MSSTPDPEPDPDPDPTDGVDQVVVNTRGRASRSPRLHVPDAEDPTKPQCGQPARKGQWRVKPIEVYPPAWRNWCSFCVDGY